MKKLIKLAVRKGLNFGWGELMYRKITKSTPESVRARVLFIESAVNSDAKPPSIFIETGTHLGDTVWQLKDSFEKLYTIEIEPHFFRFAERRFGKEPHIQVLKGDSGEVLAGFLPAIKDRCFFFLDAHYSGFTSGKGKKLNPIFEELSAIQKHSRNDHIILIDDAHRFNGQDGYPTKEELISQLKGINPNYRIEEKEGMFIAIPF